MPFLLSLKIWPRGDIDDIQYIYSVSAQFEFVSRGRVVEWDGAFPEFGQCVRRGSRE